MNKQETIEKWGIEVVEKAMSMYETDFGKVFFPEDCRGNKDDEGNYEYDYDVGCPP